MKKIILAIYTTVFSLAVHAVTVNWNEDVDWGDIQWHQKVISKGGEIKQDHIKPDTKWAFRLNMRFSKGVPTSGCLLMLGGTTIREGKKETGGIMLSLSENGLTASLTDENHTATFSGTATLEMGLNQIVLAVDRRGAGTDYQAFVSVFVNGQECLTYEGRLGGVTFDRVTLGRGYEETDVPMNFDGVSWNTYVTSSGLGEDNHYEGIADIREVYETLFLPEPTVFALLMLGCGTVLLRRKVA